MTKKPHKHAEVIKAWAMGETIEYCAPADGSEWKTASLPEWIEDYEYRVKPAREYPESGMKHSELHTAYMRGCADGDVVWNSAGCAEVANAALRHAIDAGQVVTREEFDRAISARAARDLEVAMAVRDKCRDVTVGHSMRTGVLDEIKRLDLFAIIDAIK